MLSDLNFEAQGGKIKITGSGQVLTRLFSILPPGAEKYCDHILVPGTIAAVQPQVKQLLSADKSSILRQKIAASCAGPGMNMMVARLL